MGLQRGQAKCELLRDRGAQNQAAPAPQPPGPPVRGGSLPERIQKGPPPAVGGGRKGLALVQTEVVVRHQTTTLPVRVPWNGFPEVVVHSSIYKLKNLPEYSAAKRGNDRAAARIAWTLVRPERIECDRRFRCSRHSNRTRTVQCDPSRARRRVGKVHWSEALVGRLPNQ